MYRPLKSHCLTVFSQGLTVTHPNFTMKCKFDEGLNTQVRRAKDINFTIVTKSLILSAPRHDVHRSFSV